MATGEREEAKWHLQRKLCQMETLFQHTRREERRGNGGRNRLCDCGDGDDPLEPHFLHYHCHCVGGTSWVNSPLFSVSRSFRFLLADCVWVSCSVGANGGCWPSPPPSLVAPPHQESPCVPVCFLCAGSCCSAVFTCSVNIYMCVCVFPRCCAGKRRRNGECAPTEKLQDAAHHDGHSAVAHMTLTRVLVASVLNRLSP